MPHNMIILYFRLPNFRISNIFSTLVLPFYIDIVLILSIVTKCKIEWNMNDCGKLLNRDTRENWDVCCCLCPKWVKSLQRTIFVPIMYYLFQWLLMGMVYWSYYMTTAWQRSKFVDWFSLLHSARISYTWFAMVSIEGTSTGSLTMDGWTIGKR